MSAKDRISQVFNRPSPPVILYEPPVNPETWRPRPPRKGQYDDIRGGNARETLVALAIHSSEGGVTKERLITALGEAIEEGCLPKDQPWQELYDRIRTDTD